MSLQPPSWSSRESCTYNNCTFGYKNYKIKTHTVLHIHTIKYTFIYKNEIKTQNAYSTPQIAYKDYKTSIYHYLSIKHVNPKFCSECGRQSQGPNLGWKAVPLLYPLECERLMPTLRLNLGYIKFTVIMTRLPFSALVFIASYPGLQSRGGRPGIHCLRMRLISPKILENRISRYSSVKR